MAYLGKKLGFHTEVFEYFKYYIIRDRFLYLVNYLVFVVLFVFENCVSAAFFTALYQYSYSLFQ